jgi:hypothetical protein
MPHDFFFENAGELHFFVLERNKWSPYNNAPWFKTTFVLIRIMNLKGPRNT